MKGLLCCLIALTLLAGAGQALGDDERFEIRLLERSWVPAEGISAGTRSVLAEAGARAVAEGETKVHALVQLHAIPSEEEKNDLWRDGLDLGAYVPGQAYIAAIAVKDLDRTLAHTGVRAVVPWDASRKLHPRLKVKEIASWARDPSRPEWVMLVVQLHHDIDLDRLYRLADKLGGALMEPLEGLHGGTLWLPESQLHTLAQREEVLWVEEGPPPLSANNDGIRAQMRIEPLFAAPYGLDGTGVRPFVFDAGTVRTTHETFRVGAGASHVTTIDAQGINDHPTHVAGTLGGDGAPTSAGGRGRGVAIDTRMFSAGYQQVGGTMFFWDNAGDIQADYALARNTWNADFGTNSIGSNTAANGYPCAREGDYGVSSNLLDGIVRGNNGAVNGTVLMTWAAGNERSGAGGRCGPNYLTTAPPACAKNPIHVGALNSDGGSMTRFSSWGPCDDGRLKPVVSAPGCETGRVTGETFIYSSLAGNDTLYGGNGWCGTSMATPAVAGVVSLFIEDWRARGFGGANARPLPALVKAMLVHSARDLGQDGPDFIHGYGAVDAKALIDLSRAGNNVLTGTAPRRWGTDTVSQGQTDAFTITVPAGTGELKATLAWDDFAAAAFAAFAPVNNLNLELVAPGGAILRPWILNAANPHLDATTGINNLDNQEQVRVTNPAAGVWTVRVVGTAVPQGPQTYGLTFTALPNRHNASLCTTTSFGFEAGNDGFTLNGAQRVAAPAGGHGAFSLRLGGAVSTTHEATRALAIPAGVGRAQLSFFGYMTTQRTGVNWHNDTFAAEIRNAAGTAVLAVVDFRTDGWRQGQWIANAHVDLSAWAGQTVQLAFRAVNDASLFTTFWVDDVSLVTCPLARTDVWSRDDTADTGVEPNPNTGGMWMSPDIWNRTANDAGTAHQNPEFGQPNYLNGNIRNRSLVEGVNVPVQFYVANASAGLSWPTNWTLVGTAVLPSVMPGQVVVARVPWNPPGVGHFCVVMRIATSQDPMTFAEGTNITTNTRNNNNIAWRNMNVVNLIPPGTVEQGRAAVNNGAVELIVRNIDEENPTRINLVFREEPGNEDTAGSIFDSLALTVTLDPTMAEIWAAEGGESAGIERIDDLTFSVVSDQAYIALTFEPLAEFVVQMQMAQKATPVGNNAVPEPIPLPLGFTRRLSVVEMNADDPTAEPIGGVSYDVHFSRLQPVEPF